MTPKADRYLVKSVFHIPGRGTTAVLDGDPEDALRIGDGLTVFRGGQPLYRTVIGGIPLYNPLLLPDGSWRPLEIFLQDITREQLVPGDEIHMHRHLRGIDFSVPALPGVFRVTDLFSITGRGRMALGRLVAGTIRVGEQVTVFRRGKQIAEAQLAGIESLRRSTPGLPSTALLLTGIPDDLLQRGDEIHSLQEDPHGPV